MPNEKLIFDMISGDFVPREASYRATFERVAWEHREKEKQLSAPPSGCGLDGRPLQINKFMKGDRDV